jgi:mitochondrial fission protein ELM1
LSAKPLACWVITDGKAGMESQCVGLAEALGLAPIIKRVRLRPPWRYVTPYLRLGGRLQFEAGSSALDPPWPDLVIATGRHSVAAALFVRTQSINAGRPALAVQLQDPVISPRNFDLVVVPRHDELEGANVVSTRGALHRVTPERLHESAAFWAPRFAHLRRPYIAVLIGGSNAAYRFGAPEMKLLAEQLARAASGLKASLLITPSRRTGEESLRILRSALRASPHFIWDGEGENPYFGLLALADFIVVTADSVNMVSEAAVTGKPVYVVELPGGSEKFARFHRRLREEGVTRAFLGTLEPYSYGPVDDMALVAARVRTLIPALRNAR